MYQCISYLLITLPSLCSADVSAKVLTVSQHAHQHDPEIQAAKLTVLIKCVTSSFVHLPQCLCIVYNKADLHMTVTHSDRDWLSVCMSVFCSCSDLISLLWLPSGGSSPAQNGFWSLGWKRSRTRSPETAAGQSITTKTQVPKTTSQKDYTTQVKVLFMSALQRYVRASVSCASAAHASPNRAAVSAAGFTLKA